MMRAGRIQYVHDQEPVRKVYSGVDQPWTSSHSAERAEEWTAYLPDVTEGVMYEPGRDWPTYRTLSLRRVSVVPWYEDTSGPGETAEPLVLWAESETDANSPSEELTALPKVRVEGVGVLPWLQRAGRVSDVLQVVRQLRRYFPSSGIVVGLGEEPATLEPVKVAIVADGDAEAFYQALNRFDYGWWLKQDKSLRDDIGVYIG